MTPTVTVIGSGASGVHFALTVLEKGGSVRMVDVGRQARAAVLPGATLNGLKSQLPDPAEYFLGRNFDSVLLPGVNDEYYGIPPSKDYVFDHPEGFGHNSTGFAPLFSFARGGLGEAWTAGCYPLTAGETVDFPFPHADLARGYDEVARRIGVAGEDDDLARFLPIHAHLMPPIGLDRHSQQLVDRYARVKAELNSAGAFLGRTRVATLSEAMGAREACTHLGRCLWGCPRGSIYTPSQTLNTCLGHPRFEYLTDLEVTHLRLGPGGRVQGIVARRPNGSVLELAADRVALAAGALLSTRILLQTLTRELGRRLRLHGLMDNRQVLVPFLNLSMLGAQFSADTYQYHLLGMGFDDPSPRDYVHAQITTLKTALVHPLIQRLPFGLGASTSLFRSVHAALGLINVNFRDTRREESFVELTADDQPRLRIHYAPDRDEPDRIDRTLRRVKRALRKLNCIVPPGMVHVRPMGASVHYAGTVPMTADAQPLSATPEGQSRDIPNLFLADGATFPFLPAKNITFTLMANAVRIAKAAI